MSTVTTDPLLAYREQFPTLEKTLHFASHTLGAMPIGVEASLLEYARVWRERGIRAWEEEWLPATAKVSGSLEHLMNAERGSVSLHQNVTIAQAVAFSCVDFTPERNKVVCSAEDFHSELYLYEGLVRRGAQIVRVPAREGRRIEAADLVAAIDEHTAVVAVSHVLFRTAQIVDIAPVIARAREVGALSLIDAYQALGVIEADVRALDMDMLTGGSVKWLCGGPGTSFLYVKPSVASRLRPALTGWLGHEQPFAFDSGPHRIHGGERRFWNGTPSIPATMASGPGFAIVSEIGATAIRAKSLRQTARMIALADEYGFPLLSPREDALRGGTICLSLPNAEAVCHDLLAQDVLLDFRPGVGLRLAPHFYTRDDEVDEVMRRVREAAAKHA
jgi:kynureninase